MTAAVAGEHIGTEARVVTSSWLFSKSLWKVKSEVVDNFRYLFFCV